VNASYLVENDRERARLKSFVVRLTDEELGRSLGDGWTVAAALMHLVFWDRFAAFGPIPPYYRPGGWVPHCTLAMGFDADLLPRVVELCHRAVRPIRGRFESIGLVEYGPRREHFVFGFADTGRAGP